MFSNIRKISEKRLKKGETLCWNSTIKAKKYTLKKSPIRKVSKKSANLWAEARKKCFEKYGKKCFLCGATSGEFHCHHILLRSEYPKYKYNIDNLCILCQNCHNHNGKDKNYFIILKKIIEKISIIKYNKLNDEFKRVLNDKRNMENL